MTGEPADWQTRADELAADAVDAGEPTAWFEQLYAEGASGAATMAWDRAEPNPLLVRWATAHNAQGGGHRAVVVGAGLGADAAYLAGLGFETTAFDISPTAVAIASERATGPHVKFVTADLLALPPQWRQAFSLVVEIYTVQALPRSMREKATHAVGQLVASGGTLVVIQAELRHDDSPTDGPPWPLTRNEIEAFAADSLTRVRIDQIEDAANPAVRRWLAEFTRR
jgi:ubiquinone/menaquinone biosynthesis C-methylase UbiE